MKKKMRTTPEKERKRRKCVFSSEYIEKREHVEVVREDGAE